VRPAKEATPLPAPGDPEQREPDLSQGIADHQDRWARPLAATKPLELVARWEATDQIPRALAFYDALGQLHVSEIPEQEVARLWYADPQSAIVVRTWEQAAAVRRAIAQERAARLTEPTAGRQRGVEDESAGQHPAEPIVVIAEAAYRSRAEGERLRWMSTRWSAEESPQCDLAGARAVAAA
jgi:hypothetical protein